MQNHTPLTDWQEDPCPVHNTPIRKIYTFGRYADAEVVTFSGCSCAVCINAASLLLGEIGGEYTYHTSDADQDEGGGRYRSLRVCRLIFRRTHPGIPGALPMAELQHRSPPPHREGDHGFTLTRGERCNM
jgi:hypothetical protein